jgi:CheY-like chemotaxis protein
MISLDTACFCRLFNPIKTPNQFVLIIDDDADDRELLGEALTNEGLEPILSLESAQQVFSYLQAVEKDEDLPTLIITDLNMQGMSGLELLQALQGAERYRHLPVVIYSTSSYSKDIRKCLLAGAKQYITKPSTYNGFREVTASLKQHMLSPSYLTISR